jgi:DNA helicase-2/ATP-dependent DNA helicase PcrA
MFYADLHVHSKYSRATSKDCDLEHLYLWARKKGISVVGTGDFTHPAWMAELREKLVPAEPGLFRLREDLERELEQRLHTAPELPTRFMLSVEISNIYKRADKTRKIHNLIYAPDFESAARFAGRLGRIGNIASDGRPILGLDSRDLLEIALEAGPDCYLVPAHIWTPWFAVLGSKSGFDAVEDCYADLASHVFAVETGLSSDPAMNWRLSGLDRYRLVSSSDAHSPPKLGREATRYTTELDYYAIKRALETGDGFAGTIEFFPEEGKYHLDGHRNCEVCLEPSQAREHADRCPVCGKPLTLGVLHRVEELADRPVGHVLEGAAAFDCLVPLPELLGEALGVGPSSQRVQVAYERMVHKLGPELHILGQVPLEDVEREASPVVAEAIARMRRGQVVRQAGYDGEYGVIRMFQDGELTHYAAPSLFAEHESRAERAASAPATAASEPGTSAREQATMPASDLPPSAASSAESPQLVLPAALEASPSLLDGLDPDQRAAASIVAGPLLIIAGPGTGKTRTLTHRIAHLIRDHGVAPSACLALTFTRRAADEMRERLHALLGPDASAIDVSTFHALGAAMLRDHGARLGLPAELKVATQAEQLEALRIGLDLNSRDAARLLGAVSKNKRTRAPAEPGSELEQASAAYERNLRARGLVDFDDLVGLPLALFERDPELAARYRARYRHLAVDEYQDIDAQQYRLVRMLAQDCSSVCAIGDPDQAIYAFRGADVEFFVGFRRDFATAQVVQLTRNYRSNRAIVDAASQMIRRSSLVPERRLEAHRDEPIKVEFHEASSDRAEAEFVAHRIEQLIGGYSFYSVDSGRIATGDGENHGFCDFALLYRSARQLESIEPALIRAGIPFERRSHAPFCEDDAVQALLAALEQGPRHGSVLEQLTAAAATLATHDPARVQGILAMLQTLARRAGSDRDGFLAELRSGLEIDAWDARADRVALLTLHAAKGLEFDTVFVMGCEEGVLPLSFGGKTDLDEERRLFYVGMTRARRRLVLSHARQRHWQGQLRELPRCRFVDDIEQRLLDVTRSAPAPSRARRTKSQLDLF